MTDVGPSTLAQELCRMAADEIDSLRADLAYTQEQLADQTRRWEAVVDERDYYRAEADTG